jgi:hypothetical protein
MGWYQRADYHWILLADPPVCRGGRPDVVLNNCDRLRKGEICLCRFETQEIVDDLALAGAAGALDDWLTSGDLEEQDVEEMTRKVLSLVREAQARGPGMSGDEAAAVDRLDGLARRLRRLVDRGSGLSDRYADDLD